MASKYDLSSIEPTLDEVYEIAQTNVLSGKSSKADIAENMDFIDAIEELSSKSEAASAVFTNIITGISIKLAFPNIDSRYHQTGIQGKSSLGITWFNHRGVSETIIYPWLSKRRFNGAKSGWQTRTLERPKPYMLTYDENIGQVKDSFLKFYDYVEKIGPEKLKSALVYLLELQIIIRESKRIQLVTPNVTNIATIVGHLKKHFNYKYRGKGASRLPVLALYAVLEIVKDEMTRYKKWNLKKLESHSAADSQTGASGDIEFEDEDGKLVEGIEVKHNIVIDGNLVEDVITKISPFQLDRYYILTTHSQCGPSELVSEKLDEAEKKIGCQIVVNGVIPTIQYYLRLVKEPQKIYSNYTALLSSDSSVTHEHKEAWNKIILGK